MRPNQQSPAIVRNLLRAFLAMALVFAGSSVHAEMKIAVLNMQRAIAESEEAKSMIEKIQRELQTQEKDVNKIGEEIQALQKRLEREADTLSNSEKRRLAKEIEDKGIDYKFQGNKLQKEVQDRQQEVIAAMLPKVDTVLQDIIKKERFDMVLQRSNQMLYINDRHNITSMVTEALNKKR
ncbi:MAG: OmpH family outer membrane protein [Pseudomonadota bacterium]